MKPETAHLLAILEATEDYHADHERVLQASFEAAKRDVAYYQQARDDEIKAHRNAVEERKVRVAQLGEEIAVLKEKVNVANATRDLVIRMVNQFTSLQITPLGTTLQRLDHDNLPSELRKT